MKALTTAAIALMAVSTAALAVEPGPADKKDSGSLSSGAKQALPATKNKAENSDSAAGAMPNAENDMSAENGPAEKKDSGSLSSGAKQALPSTKNQGENSDSAEGASSGGSGVDSGTGMTGPADKKDGGSLSSGAKQAVPTTKNQGENSAQ